MLATVNFGNHALNTHCGRAGTYVAMTVTVKALKEEILCLGEDRFLAEASERTQSKLSGAAHHMFRIYLQAYFYHRFYSFI